jgi:hypothetical protein
MADTSGRPFAQVSPDQQSAATAQVVKVLKQNQRKRAIPRALLAIMVCVVVCVAGSQAQRKPILVEGKGLRCGIDPASGLPVWLESAAKQGRRIWLNEPAHVSVRSEVSEVSASWTDAKVTEAAEGGVTVTARLEPLQLSVTQRWTGTPSGLLWDLSFDGAGKRAGHEVTIDLTGHHDLYAQQ